MMHVRVPATTANLGPGFDRLGLALQRYFDVHAAPADAWRIETSGFGAADLPTDEQNLIARAYTYACNQKGWLIKPLKISAQNSIPVNAGLGSSATAIVAGLALAYLTNHQTPDRQQIFALAAAIEGHPDNVAPAVFGGLCDCRSNSDGTFQYQARPIHPDIQLVVAEVDDRAETSAMRNALPKPTPQAAITKAQALVETLLEGLRDADPEKLKLSEADPIHQPYRFPLLQRSQQVYEHFCANQDLSGAFLSGSGPTVAAWLRNKTQLPASVEAALSQLPFNVRSSVLAVDTLGFSFT